MSLVATTPAVTGATRPDFSSRIVTLAAAMASLCLIVPLLIFAARIIQSSPVLNALFFPRLPILAILFFSAVGVAGYGRLKGLGERWLHDLVETSSEQLAAGSEKGRSTALYSTITVLSGLTLFLELVLIRWREAFSRSSRSTRISPCSRASAALGSAMRWRTGGLSCFR
jgi:hypothetical protein